MKRVYVWRWVAILGWLLLCGLTIAAEMAVLEITHNAGLPLKINAAILTVVSYALSWGISLLYKSNRDTAVDEMGPKTLAVYHAMIGEMLTEQQRQRGKYELELAVDPAAKEKK